MKTIAKEFFDMIDDRDDLTDVIVAKQINVAKTTISKFRNSNKIGFNKLVKITNLYYENSREVMRNWCFLLSETENIKQSFEFAAITRDIPLLESLLKFHSNEDGEIKEYLSVYSIILSYMKNEIKGTSILKELADLKKLSDKFLNILVNIYKCYGYYFEQDYPMMLSVAKDVEKELCNIGDRGAFFKECFRHRLSEALCQTYLHYNNVEMARYHALFIINSNICAKTISDGYYTLGMSFLREDAEKCIAYLLKSRDVMVCVGDEDLIKETEFNLDFAKWYIDKNSTDFTSKPMLALSMAAKGEKVTQEAADSVYKMSDENFIKYYEALLSGEREALCKLFKNLLEKCSFFLSSIVAKTLEEAGENSMLLEMLMDVSYKLKGDVKFEEKIISSFGSGNFGAISIPA